MEASVGRREFFEVKIQAVLSAANSVGGGDGNSMVTRDALL